MRILPRAIVFLLIGLTLVFSLSGILLVYRQTGLLKSDTEVARTLPGGLSSNEIGKELRLRKLKLDGDELLIMKESDIMGVIETSPSLAKAA